VTPRWGIPDALWCWLAGFAGAIFGATVAAAFGADLASNGVLFGVAVPAQYAAIVLTAVVISNKKGTGSLAHDFGWRVDQRHAIAALAGAGIQFVMLYLLVPIVRLANLGNKEPQDIVERAKETHGAGMILLIVVATAVVAPVVEELVFRGVLLRALLRRTTEGPSIGISALAFAAVHVVADPGSRFVFPGLFALGIVLAILAIRDRSLSRPIFMHGGFNLLATLLTFAAR